MNHKSNLTGVFAPVVTPFDKDKIRFDWLDSNLLRLSNTNLKGYLALGSNGEFMSLTEEEQLEVLKNFVRRKEGKILMTGASRESVNGTIEFARKAIDLGSDYISLLPPHYFLKQMNEDALFRYYTSVADVLAVPVLLYNAPGFSSSLVLSNGLVARLAEHPNIVGMKDSSPSGMNGYLSSVRAEDFCMLAGSANFYFSAISLGATGGIISLANSLPHLCCDFHNIVYRLPETGDIQAAVTIHNKIFRLNQAVSGKHGVAGVKASMNLMGYRGGEPRQPLAAIAREQEIEMKNLFERMDVLDLLSVGK